MTRRTRIAALAGLGMVLGALPRAARAEEPALAHEVTPEISFYSADTLRTMTLFGASYTWRAFDTVWFSAEGLAGEVVIDDDSVIDARGGDLFLVATLAVIYNMPVRLGLTDEDWIGDLYTSVGPAYIIAGDEQVWGGFLGGGLTAHTSIEWLALKADVKSFFYSLPNRGGGDLNVDLEIALGPVIKF